MLFSDSYITITEKAQLLYKSKGSKFFAFAYPIQKESEIKAIIAELKMQYPDATHHCYAYVLGMDKSAFRANDDGEPSGTAGKPILRQIQKMELTNTLVVVVRYFGGTLLGVNGLIEAYGESAAEVLKICPVKTHEITEKYVLSCDFGEEKDIYRVCKQFQLQTVIQHDPSCFSAEIKIPLRIVAPFKAAIKDLYHLRIQYTGIE
jgi:uncharacterized YigZ family protein